MTPTDNRPNYRITIRPDSNIMMGVLTNYAIKNKWHYSKCKFDIAGFMPFKCIGIQGYHPDSSKLKK